MSEFHWHIVIVAGLVWLFICVLILANAVDKIEGKLKP